jgi:hypothetical protein
VAVDPNAVPLLSHRAIEAKIVAKIYAAAESRLGRDAALAFIGEAISAAAFESGRAFAAKAPHGRPCLTHFTQVVDLWRTGGALDIADIRHDAQTLRFNVTRCGYMDMYRELGVPQELHAVLSCSRDAAFAAGYSPRLTLERPETIARGCARCAFLFRWT